MLKFSLVAAAASLSSNVLAVETDIDQLISNLIDTLTGEGEDDFDDDEFLRWFNARKLQANSRPNCTNDTGNGTNCNCTNGTTGNGTNCTNVTQSDTQTDSVCLNGTNCSYGINTTLSDICRPNDTNCTNVTQSAGSQQGPQVVINDTPVVPVVTPAPLPPGPAVKTTPAPPAAVKTTAPPSTAVAAKTAAPEKAVIEEIVASVRLNFAVPVAMLKSAKVAILFLTQLASDLLSSMGSSDNNAIGEMKAAVAKLKQAGKFVQGFFRVETLARGTSTLAIYTSQVNDANDVLQEKVTKQNNNGDVTTDGNQGRALLQNFQGRALLMGLLNSIEEKKQSLSRRLNENYPTPDPSLDVSKALDADSPVPTPGAVVSEVKGKMAYKPVELTGQSTLVASIQSALTNIKSVAAGAASDAVVNLVTQSLTDAITTLYNSCDVNNANRDASCDAFNAAVVEAGGIEALKTDIVASVTVTNVATKTEVVEVDDAATAPIAPTPTGSTAGPIPSVAPVQPTAGNVVTQAPVGTGKTVGTTTDEEEEGGAPVGAIVGGAVGGIIAIVVVILVLQKRKKDREVAQA